MRKWKKKNVTVWWVFILRGENVGSSRVEKWERHTPPPYRRVVVVYNKWSKIPTNQETHLSRTRCSTCETDGYSIRTRGILVSFYGLEIVSAYDQREGVDISSKRNVTKKDTWPKLLFNYTIYTTQIPERVHHAIKQIVIRFT